MNRIKYSILGLVFGVSALNAQTEGEKAKTILDSLSSTTKSYSSISVDFEIQMSNKAEDINEKQTGHIDLSGNKYKLSLGPTMVLFNDAFKWTVLTDAEEVTKEAAEDMEGNGELAPSKIFTMYEDGFKYRFTGEETVDGVKVAVIELVPENPADKSYSRAIVHVDQAKNQMTKFVLKGKDGNVTTYSFKTFETNKDFGGQYFDYTNALCPGCEVLE